MSACRFCGAGLQQTFADLGVSPLSNAYIPVAKRDEPELFYPLHVKVCAQCRLVQLPECAPPESIFQEYAYFSSYSESWLEHARQYADMAIERFSLTANSQVVEIASNDGYLLQFFQERGIPNLGIEPSDNVAEAARHKGLQTWSRFFGRALGLELQEQGLQADLLIGNNVLAHVPDLNDFVAGLRQALKPDGVLTLEFPHLTRLVQERQFDTIYHEHFSYFSLTCVQRILNRHGLHLFDVEPLRTHGGSLRIYARHAERSNDEMGAFPAVSQLLAEERAIGVESPGYYQTFHSQVRAAKREILAFFIREKSAGKTIAGFGAPAKGNTLLNYCGIGPDFIDYTVDSNPHKQGMLLPGSRIPVFAPDKLAETQPDLIVILPWNLRDEIRTTIKSLRDNSPDLQGWSPRCATLIPNVDVFSL